jgi:hypothetical protein
LPVAVDEDLVRVVRIEARSVRAALAAGAIHARVALAAVHALSAQHGAPGPQRSPQGIGRQHPAKG